MAPDGSIFLQCCSPQLSFRQTGLIYDVRLITGSVICLSASAQHGSTTKGGRREALRGFRNFKGSRKLNVGTNVINIRGLSYKIRWIVNFNKEIGR